MAGEQFLKTSNNQLQEVKLIFFNKIYFLGVKGRQDYFMLIIWAVGELSVFSHAEIHSFKLL